MEENKTNTKSFSTAETIVLVIIVLIIGFAIGFLFNNKKEPAKELNDEYLAEFIKNYNYIIDNYYEDVDKEKLINKAISGMMESLEDPYSVYFDENETNNFSVTLDGSYDGFGIQIAKYEENGYMLVTGVFKNSPAAESGLQPGDFIISIDDKQAKDMDATEFSSLVRNSKKEKYTLKILRDDTEQEITINKKTVTLASVASDYYEQGNKKIGYIYIGIFANNTAEQFKEELKKLEEKNIDALIIDVRGNSGGHLTTVDSILDIFLNKNQIMYGFEKNGKKTYTKATGKDNKKYEIVLLGDENSASASEVLIAGLKDNLNSKFIGMKTYGKGTVQEVVTLSDGTQYKMTIKKWLTPKGVCITDTKGITPDIEIKLDDKYYETYLDSDDNQLQEAIKYIIGE